MAKISVNICDLCKSQSKEDLEFQILTSKKGQKAKDRRTAEICLKCFDDIMIKLDGKWDINPQPSNEATFVKSANKTPIAKQVKKETDGCEHNKKSFDAENSVLVCRDCGHKMKLP